MSRQKEIKPEWIPNAYSPDSSKAINNGRKTADVQQSFLLYPDKDTLVKRRHIKIYKKR